MARTEMPNATLFAIAIELSQLQKNNLGIAFLNKEKVNRFFQHNAMLLKIIDSRRAEFIKKYVKHDELGNPITEKDDKGVERYLFETPELEAEYKAVHEEFMNRYVHVES